MKKCLLFVLLAICCVAMVGAQGATQTKPAVESQEPVTIKYAFWGSPDALGVEADIIKGFQEKYPYITVEPVASGYADYHTKLLTMIAGGSAPDVMRISSQFFYDFLDAGGLLELTDIAKKNNFDLPSFYQQGLEENSFNGKLYGIPWGTAPIYMLLNLKMFEDAGIPLPAYDWTWDDFESIVKKLTKGEGQNKQYGFAMEIQADLYPMLPFIWANGGQFLDEARQKFMLDKPEAYQAIQRVANLYQQGYMPKETLLVATQTESVPRWFINNKLAMFQGTAANILTIQNAGTPFEAWPMPSSKNSTHTTVVKSNTIGISPQSKNLDAAWKFVSYLRGDEGESMYMKAKRVPPSIDNVKYWNLYSDPNLYPKKIAEVTSKIFTDYGHLAPLRKGYLEMEQMLAPIIQNVFLGQTTAEAAMKNVAPRIQAILDRSK